MTDIPQRIGIQIQNDSAMDIPPFSIVVVTSVEATTGDDLTDSVMIHHVNQYGCGMAGNVFVTGEVTIPQGSVTGNRNGDPASGASFGRGYADQFIYVAIDSTAPRPNPGEEWGPVDNSWTITKGGKGFWAQGYADTGDSYKRAMFLRTFFRAPPSICSSSSSSESSSSGSSSGSSQGSVSGSASSSAGCGCITVVTSVSCGSGGLSVTYGQARGCC